MGSVRMLLGLLVSLCVCQATASVGEQFCKEYSHLHLCRLRDNLEGALSEIQYLVEGDAGNEAGAVGKRKSAFVRFGKRPAEEDNDSQEEVEKRKSAFVRFGRADSEKRKSSYIRFG